MEKTGIKIVSKDFLDALLSNDLGEYRLKDDKDGRISYGRFILPCINDSAEQVFVAVDNTQGYAWTEEFDTLEGAVDWLSSVGARDYAEVIIEVKDGVVQNVHAEGDVNVQIIDLDDSKSPKAEKHKVCETCGHVINEEEEFAYPVNPGTDDEYVQCEICHDSDWEENKIIICESCGEWFTPDKIHSEHLTDTCAFSPCPNCGNDIVEGCSKEEMLRNFTETSNGMEME